MTKLLCHSVLQKAEIFKIEPTRENVQDEFVLYLDKCVVCNRPILEIHRIDIWGNILKPVRLKTQNIRNFLDSMSVIWKPNKLHFKTYYSKFYLNYNEYGKVKKCFQNLSRVSLGKTETDLYADLRNFKSS